MNIGIPKEIRPSEYRVGLTPAGVEILAERGHTCYVESGAGLGAGFTNHDYERVGGVLVYSAHEVFGRSDLVLKVTRPKEEELNMMRPETALAGNLHLASARQSRIDLLLEKRITAISYDQIQLDDGSRPVLRPLSAIGGRMVAQVAAELMQNDAGGKGILLGGMPGVPPAEVVIIGAGVAGVSAAYAFLGMGAQLTVLDIDWQALENIYAQNPEIVTMICNERTLNKVCGYADVLVTAASSPGAPAPLLIRRGHLRLMKPRALIMDISIDQGGCVETSRPTTHDSPTFEVDGIVHYCVPNMGGVVARTSSHVFSNAAIPYIEEMAEKGVDQAIEDNPALARAVNTYKGEVRSILRFSPPIEG